MQVRAESDKGHSRTEIEVSLRRLFARLLGLPADQVPLDVSFVELGADSLLLVEATEVISDNLGIDVPFRDMLDAHADIASLAGRVAELGGRAPDASAAAEDRDTAARRLEPLPTAPEHVAVLPEAPPPSEGSEDSSLEREVIGLQIELMRRQLELLRSRRQPSSQDDYWKPPTAAPEPPGGREGAAEALGPHRPIEPYSGRSLAPDQLQHVKELVTSLESRMGGSKRLAARQRTVHADSRMSAGFHALWKEIVYPITADRASGSRFTDVDGNEFVDISMDFGVNLFGHAPPDIQEAISAQLAKGTPLAPFNTSVGPVSELMTELTGLPRVAFQNSGTEAVMVAIRAARAATGRKKIVIFSASYHGTFDGVLARGSADPALPPGTAVPLTRGTPPSMAQDVIVADFAQPSALDLIAANAAGIAAVLVEPIQSRTPQVQPFAWLRDLRALTSDLGIALIFDEVITGFRLHPGGVQALSGVRADLAAYGKVIGGGLPIGAVCGSERFMAPVDGGLWTYGDDSWPSAGTMAFAGTFSKHPLAMAAAHAALRRIRDESPRLQDELDRRTGALQTSVNSALERDHIPLRVERAGSLFRFSFGRGFGFPDLFFHHLLHLGVYVWEGRNCYLSTAHTDEDVTFIVDAVRTAVEEMSAQGFIRTDDGASGE